jgi:DNA-binding NarL/FixJ family response regulator
MTRQCQANGRAPTMSMPGLLLLSGMTKETTAILFERRPSPEVTLYGISKKYNLTKREREAMGHLLRGLTSKEIAQEMNISPNTVKPCAPLMQLVEELRCAHMALFSA